MSTTPAGWYDDTAVNARPGTERYWDGRAWTAHTREVPAPPVDLPSFATAIHTAAPLQMQAASATSGRFSRRTLAIAGASAVLLCALVVGGVNFSKRPGTRSGAGSTTEVAAFCGSYSKWLSLPITYGPGAEALKAMEHDAPPSVAGPVSRFTDGVNQLMAEARSVVPNSPQANAQTGEMNALFAGPYVAIVKWVRSNCVALKGAELGKSLTMKVYGGGTVSVKVIEVQNTAIGTFHQGGPTSITGIDMSVTNVGKSELVSASGGLPLSIHDADGDIAQTGSYGPTFLGPSFDLSSPLPPGATRTGWVTATGSLGENQPSSINISFGVLPGGTWSTLDPPN